MDSARLQKQALVAELGLSPHPEGGHFIETFRAPTQVEATNAGGLSSSGLRSSSTAIYFLLGRGEVSRFHRVRSDEVWHFYLGDALELHTLNDAGEHEVHILGCQLHLHQRPQFVVAAGVWQAARPVAGGSFGFSLMGCTVAPGFEFADFEMPSLADLISRFPMHRKLFESFERG